MATPTCKAFEVYAAGTEDLPKLVEIQKAGFYQTAPDRDETQLREDLSSGSMILCASVDGRLVGYVQDFPREGWLWSQTAVFLPEFQGQGLGYRLKRAQREIALERGFRWMKWRYNPRRTRNAMLNLGKLGGRVLEVEPFVHPVKGPFNYFHVTWDLECARPVPFPDDVPVIPEEGPMPDGPLARLPIPLIDKVSDEPDVNPLLTRVSNQLIATGQYSAVSFRIHPCQPCTGEYLFARQ